MRVKYLTLIAAIILLAGCTNDIDTTTTGTAEVTVKVSDFAVAQTELPSSKTRTAVEDYEALKALTLAFYKSDGTEVYKYTQLKDDGSTYTTFGVFTCSLPMGSYTMVVIGRAVSAGDVLNLTSATSAEYTSDHVRETFATTQTVNVNTNAALNLSAELERVIAKVQVVSTDLRTADVSNIRMTFSAGSKGFNPTTGLATTNTGFANTLQGHGAVGSTTTATSYLFLASDPQTVNITIETLDALGNTLFSKVVEDVPLKRNRLTTLTGAMYTNTGVSGSGFTVNTEWLTGNSVDF